MVKITQNIAFYPCLSVQLTGISAFTSLENHQHCSYPELFSCKTKTPHPLNAYTPFPAPLVPGNHGPTFHLYEFVTHFNIFPSFPLTRVPGSESHWPSLWPWPSLATLSLGFPPVKSAWRRLLQGCVVRVKWGDPRRMLSTCNENV